MDVGIDLDGVLRNMVDKVIQDYTCFYDSKFNLKHDDIIHYDFRKSMPLIKDIGRFFIDHAENLFYNALPYDGAIEFVNELKSDGHKINIVTNQLKGTEIQSLKWLYEQKIPYDTIHFSKDKSLVREDFLVDDCVDNLENLVEVTLPICIDRPWNAEWKGTKFKTFDEIRSYINK